jgi:hypothetical protein
VSGVIEGFVVWGDHAESAGRPPVRATQVAGRCGFPRVRLVHDRMLAVSSAGSGLLHHCGTPCVSDAVSSCGLPPPHGDHQPVLPLVVGATWRWKGQFRQQPYTQEDVVLNYTRRIDGVVTRPVLDRDLVKGQIIAGSIDYYAQDDKGNVWYLAEETIHYVNGKLTDHADSWIGGEDGARPGIFMPAHPALGEPRFQQEYAPNVAADVEHIVSISKSVCVPLRCYAHVVQANESTVLDPGLLSAKYYAPGVGLISEDTLSGDPYSYGLTSVTWPRQGGKS